MIPLPINIIFMLQALRKSKRVHIPSIANLKYPSKAHLATNLSSRITKLSQNMNSFIINQSIMLLRLSLRVIQHIKTFSRVLRWCLMKSSQLEKGANSIILIFLRLTSSTAHHIYRMNNDNKDMNDHINNLIRIIRDFLHNKINIIDECIVITFDYFNIQTDLWTSKCKER